MRVLRELLRAAFIGFTTLAVCGGLISSNAKNDLGETIPAAELASKSSERIAMIFGLGIAGAIVGAITWLLLRWVAPGMKTKVALGPILGAFIATTTFGIRALHDGKVEDVAGLIVLGGIAGFFVALVDASRQSVAQVASTSSGDRI